MFRNSLLLSPSKTSAFDQYKNEILTNRSISVQSMVVSQREKNGKTQVFGKKPKSGVSFNMTNDVISYEGGKENFWDSDDDDGHINFTIDTVTDNMEKVEIKVDINSDLDKITASNTEYNSNPVNFKENHCFTVNSNLEQIKDSLPQPDLILGAKSAVDISPRAANPAVPNYVSIFKYPLVPANMEENSKPKTLNVKGVNGYQNLITDQQVKAQPVKAQPVKANGNHCDNRYMDVTMNKNSDQSSSPGNELSEESSKCSPDSDSGIITKKIAPAVPVRKSRSREHNSIDPRIYTGKKIGKMNKEVEERLKNLAVDLESQRKSPKRPAPPPPSCQNPTNHASHNVGKTAHARSTSLNLSVRNNVENGQRLELCQNNSRRTMSISRSPKGSECVCPPDDQLEATINGRSRFASIRKFLRFDQKPVPDKKFRSLRRFPSPFTKTRVDLAEMRTLFHSERDACNAAGEIATDSDVVVTDINEIHSAANTLSRPTRQDNDTHLAKESMALLNQKLLSIQDIKMTPKKTLIKTESEPSLYSFAPVDMGSKNDIAHDSRLEEVYDEMTMDDMIALADVADRFPDLAIMWRRSMSHIVNASDLKFNNFLVLSNLPLIVSESMALYPGALKLEQEFLDMPLPKVNILMMPIKCSAPTCVGNKKSKLPFSLPVITEFQDYVPANLFKPQTPDVNKSPNHNLITYPSKMANGENILCKIVVLPNVQFVTLKTLQDLQATSGQPYLLLDDQKICFILIQLITSLKHLQSQGIEEVRSDVDFILIMFSNFMRLPKLCMCSEFMSTEHQHSISLSSRISLCHFALKALYSMLNIEMSLAELLFRNKFPPKFFKKSLYSDTFQLVVDELLQSKSQSLTKAKSFLEYSFWVTNNSLSLTNDAAKFESEVSAKIWLENERSKEVSNLLKLMFQQPDHVDVVEEYRIQFLLQTTPKCLLEASQYANFERYDIIV